jgi:hypothetical protein
MPCRIRLFIDPGGQKPRRLSLYTVLLAVETIGVAIIIWRGVPIYQLIAKNPGPQDLDLQTVAALVAALLVQAAYWLRQALIPTLKFTSIIGLSDLILFTGRRSLGTRSRE